MHGDQEGDLWGGRDAGGVVIGAWVVMNASSPEFMHLGQDAMLL